MGWRGSGFRLSGMGVALVVEGSGSMSVRFDA